MRDHAIVGAMIGPLLCGIASPAHAQSTDATGQDALGEIVVTATRRSESIQNVPLSITAVTADSLEKRAATGFFDYGTSIPNLSFGNTAEGTSGARTIAIRGIADKDTTGFYIDDTPLPDSLDPKIVDVSRIEVLRGPQGTLFGARSMGGTVRIITEQPDAQELLGRVHGSLSTTRNTDRPNYQVDGALNVPIVADTLAVRMVGLSQYDAGYFDRRVLATGETIHNVARSVTNGGSISVLWKPTPNLSITPRLMYQETAYNGFPFSDVAVPANPTGVVILQPNSLTQVRQFDVPEGSRDRWLLGTLDVKYDVGIGTLTSSSSYFRRRNRDFEDETGPISGLLGTPPIAASIEIQGRRNAFTQEVRFSSSLKGPFQFVLGAYYNHSRITSAFPPNFILGLDAAAGGAFGTDLLFSFESRIKQLEMAGYAEGTYDITSKLRLVAGLRGFKVKTAAAQEQDGIAAGGFTASPSQTRNENGINPRFSLQYRISPGNQIYATVAKGFRPGGVNAAVPTALGCAADLAALGRTQADTIFYESDNVWSYEAGAKTSFFNRRLTANVSAFQIDWSNIQQRVQLQCGFGFRGNAGAARSQGIEFEVSARPVSGLTLEGGFGYTDAKFTENAPGTKFSKGDRVPQVPRYTLSLSGDYETPLGSSSQFFLHGDYKYVSDSTSSVNATTDASGRLIPRIRPSYSILDARVGIRLKQTELALFAKNLFDERANLSDTLAISVEQAGRARINVNQPRTIGIEARQRF